MSEIILGRKYKHINTGRVYLLYLFDISDDDDAYHRVELCEGTIEELRGCNFREIWAGTIKQFKEQWKLKE